VTLRQKIAQEIREQGPIRFSRYMEMCLYDPRLGYYSRHAKQFGKAGDFYTSSDVHAVFGRLLARQFEEMWQILGSPAIIEILELGPGRGLFARDVLDWSEKKFPGFFRALCYSLVESSPPLSESLKQTLDRHLATGKCFLRDAPLPESIRISNPTIVFANEFFDALPVEVLSAKGSVRIASEKEQLQEAWIPASTSELEYLDRHSVHPEPGERVEAGLIAQNYMERIAHAIESGFVVIVDYGYTRAELLAGRHRSTIMTYREHSSGPNPYEAPGEQDITAHVNFTALQFAAEQNGMKVEKLLTQSQFLMGIGEVNQFADAFEECQLPQERAKVALQLKHLVTPAGMGETFQVLVASKGVPAQALNQLSGLKFGQRRIE
jgi:SAM-dependent MidA family methyltransferase